MKEKLRREKNMAFFLLETLKTTFKMRNLTQNGHNQGIFFPKLGYFFPIFEKGQGRPPPLPPLVTHLISLNFFERIRRLIAFQFLRHY